MKEVFIVIHVRDFEKFGPPFSPPSEKLIGIYSSAEAAREAIGRARVRQGFADYPDGFRVETCVVDEDRLPEGFVPT